MKPPASGAPVNINPPALDNIQLLLQRKAELAKNKAKYTLTETDAKLLTTHSSEVTFEDGQMIAQEGHDVHNVYRIVSGQVAASRNGVQFKDLKGKGNFLADQLLLFSAPVFTVKVTVHAVGHVVLQQLNLPFVKQLFEIDTLLKAKVMRFLVSKYSFLFEFLLDNIDSPLMRPISSPSPSLSSLSSSSSSSSIASNLDLESSVSSVSSDSFTSSSSLSNSNNSNSNSNSNSVPSSPAFSPYNSTNNNKSKRSDRNREQAYKVYPLVANRGNGVQTLQLKSKKMTVVYKSFGFSFKTTIEYSKILHFTKVGENVATIVYQPHKVANVFFKNYYDREEFFGIVNSLTSHSPSLDVSKRNSGQLLSVPHNPDTESYDEVPLCGGADKGGDDEPCKALLTKLQFKKGDHIFEEGDLFQRVYMLTKGYCEIILRGKKICTMEEGDIYGVGTILHLRSSPVTLVAGVDSELLVVPAYKLNALIDSDTDRAAQIYRDAAIALDKKISQAMGFMPNYKRMLREKQESDLKILGDGQLTNSNSEFETEETITETETEETEDTEDLEKDSELTEGVTE